MEERRKSKRENLIYYLEILGDETGKPIGNLVNISKGGFMMICKDQMEVSKEFLLRMILPEGTYGKKTIAFKAKSCWSQVDINPAFYALGFEFVTIGLVETKTIKSLINNFAFKGS